MGDPRRRFHSLLLCIEAKVHGMLVKYLGQLVAYLGSLRPNEKKAILQSMALPVATDGFLYEAVLKKTKQFDVMDKALKTCQLY